MIKIIKEAQVRSEEDNRNLRETVAGIIGEIRGRGDAALKEYNEKFDGCTRESLRVSREEIDAAYKELGEQELADLKAAHHNIEAFANLPWPTDDYEALEAQFANVKGIRQVPGSYFTWRNVNNAFYTVAVADEDKRMQPREALYEYLEYINAEITSKREEFGMKTASDAKQ